LKTRRKRVLTSESPKPTASPDRVEETHLARRLGERARRTLLSGLAAGKQARRLSLSYILLDSCAVKARQTRSLRAF
jgi:hypothetical protein